MSVSDTCKTATIGRTAFRETGVSQCQRDPIEGPPQTRQYHGIEGSKEASNWVPNMPRDGIEGSKGASNWVPNMPRDGIEGSKEASNWAPNMPRDGSRSNFSHINCREISRRFADNETIGDLCYTEKTLFPFKSLLNPSIR